MSNTGVIHDIGYRGYVGPREGNAAIARSLYITGLRNAFGLGRSGRSKVLPFLLLALVSAPAVIMVGVLTLIRLDSLPVSYEDSTQQMQMVISLFAATAAPVLFSRDLRSRSIVLYLARPLSAMAFALIRWASLATAIFLFMFVPTLILYVGGVLAGLDWGAETKDVLVAIGLEVLLAAMLAGITGVISSVALRRGFAVVASIITLIAVSGVIVIIQAISADGNAKHVGEAVGLLSPWTIHSGLAGAWADHQGPVTPDTGWVIAYVAMAVLIALGSVALLVRRFEKVGAR